MGFCPFFFRGKENINMLNQRSDKVELLRIAESVATEKSIDKEIILTSMESAIQKAEAVSEAVKSGLTAHMINNNMHQKSIFIESISNMNNVKKLWLSRSPLVSNHNRIFFPKL